MDDDDVHFLKSKRESSTDTKPKQLNSIVHITNFEWHLLFGIK